MREISDKFKTRLGPSEFRLDGQTGTYIESPVCLTGCLGFLESQLGKEEKRKTLGGFARPPKAEPCLLVLGSVNPHRAFSPSRQKIEREMSTTSAERQRRHRARKRRGLVLARAEVPDRIVEALVDQGLLRETQATDARAIGQALVEATSKNVTV